MPECDGKFWMETRVTDGVYEGVWKGNDVMFLAPPKDTWLAHEIHLKTLTTLQRGRNLGPPEIPVIIAIKDGMPKITLKRPEDTYE